MVASAGAGPPPIPFKELCVDKLVDAIQYCLEDDVQSSVQKIAAQVRTEKGVTNAVDSFHRHLPKTNMSCDLLPRNTARWLYQVRLNKAQRRTIKLSDAAVQVLLQQKMIKLSGLDP